MMQGSLDDTRSSRSSQRFIPEDDLKSERERWLQTSMHEVWNMENAAFERINDHMEQAAEKLKLDVSEQLEQQRGEWSAALLELRGELQSARSPSEPLLQSLRSSLEGQVQALRKEMAGSLQARHSDAQAQLQSAQLQAGVSAVQATQEQQRLQLLTYEASVSELRAELALVREGQDLESAAAVAELRQEVSAFQEANVQALKEQTAKSSASASQIIQQAQDMLQAALGPMRVELKQDVERLRGNLDVESRQLEALATQVSKLEKTCGAVSGRMEELGSKMVDVQQDHLSEVTLLRSRVESGLGDRVEQQSHWDSLQLLFKEEQSRRSVDTAALQARLDALERRPKSPSPAPEGSAAWLDARKAVETLETAVAGIEDRLKQVPSLASGVDGLRQEMIRLAQDLTDERRDRCRAISDVNRITEDVANAAAATIERAKQRFVAEMKKDQDAASSPSRAPSRGDDLLSSVGSIQVAASSVSTEELRATLGTSVAKLVGEMDAELRVELTSRIRLISAELRGEVLSEVAVRVAAVDARVGMLEANCMAEVQRVDRELTSRLGMLESLRAPSRLSALEEESKSLSRALMVILDDRKKAVGTASAETETKCVQLAARAASTDSASTNATHRLIGERSSTGTSSTGTESVPKKRELGIRDFGTMSMPVSRENRSMPGSAAAKSLSSSLEMGTRSASPSKFTRSRSTVSPEQPHDQPPRSRPLDAAIPTRLASPTAEDPAKPGLTSPTSTEHASVTRSSVLRRQGSTAFSSDSRRVPATPQSSVRAPTTSRAGSNIPPSASGAPSGQNQTTALRPQQAAAPASTWALLRGRVSGSLV